MSRLPDSSARERGTRLRSLTLIATLVLAAAQVAVAHAWSDYGADEPPVLDAEAVPTKLDLAVLARGAGFVLSFESPTSGDSPGALVLRSLDGGGTIAMYDVPDVSSVAVAPDGSSFVYSTGAGRAYTAVARVPR